MLFLNKSDIEKTVDLNEMMDQIEEAYRIFGADEYYMPERPVITTNLSLGIVSDIFFKLCSLAPLIFI